MITPRDYQANAVDLLRRYFQVNAEGFPVLEAPTAAGKSVIMALLIMHILERKPDARVLALAHVKELIEQNHDKLVTAWPHAPAGIYAASLNRRDTGHPIVFASIQSVYSRPHELGRFDLILIDECHLIPAKTSSGMYRSFLDAQLGYNPALKMAGFTATPYRLDNGLLTDGDNALFADIIPAKAAGMSISDLLAAGYLSPLCSQVVESHYSTEGVGKRGGEFIPGELGASIADQFSTTAKAIDEVVKFGQDRRSWLLFATSVDHANQVATLLGDRGIVAEVVTGKTAKTERARITEAFKRGELRALVNVNVLTTGFDAPCTDLLAFLRPTHSAALYIQMAGRGMRLSPETGKTDCLVLDFADLIATHGPVTDVEPPKHRKKKGLAPTKECPECWMLLAAGRMQCPYCLYNFPIIDREAIPKINDKASDLDIMGQNAPPPKRKKLSGVVYSVHKKEGSPDSMRVAYVTGRGVACHEYVCLHHSGRAQERAYRWWSTFMPDYHVPPIIERAIELCKEHARTPTWITTTSDRYPRLAKVWFDTAGEETAA